MYIFLHQTVAIIELILSLFRKSREKTGAVEKRSQLTALL